jgi:hypothetical protein
MKSPFDQNAEQEPSSQQSYERNLSRDYAPSERAKVRALDQRAAFNEATLKQRAEAAGANAEIARSRLGLAEQRIGLADIQSQIAQEKAELANNDSKAKAMRELTVMREANGFLRDAIGMDPNKPEFDEQYQKMLAGYQNAPESKAVQEWITAHVPIAKSRRETETTIAKEKRATDEKIATEERARNKETQERMIAEVAAQEAGAVPTQWTIGGMKMETPAKADAAEAKTEMVSLEKERKLSVDQFAKARYARTRAGVVLATALETKNQNAINAAKDLVKAADDDVIESRTRRDEAESALKVRLPSKMPAAKEQPQATIGNPNGMPTPAAPAAPSPVADKPKAVRQNGKIYRLQPDGSYKE